MFRCRSRAIPAALLLAAAGCHEGTPPEQFRRVLPAHFALVSVDGTPLPVVERVLVAQPTLPNGPSGYRCEDRLTATTLDFVTEPTRYTATSQRLFVCDDGRLDQATIVIETGRYTVDDAGTVLLDTPVTASDPQASTRRTYARLTGDSLVVYRQEVTSPLGGTVTDSRPMVYRVSH